MKNILLLLLLLMINFFLINSQYMLKKDEIVITQINMSSQMIYFSYLPPTEDIWVLFGAG